MDSPRYAVYIFYPSDMTSARTPFEGEKEEMVEIAAELQEMALQRGERGMYVVRPLREPENPE